MKIIFPILLVIWFLIVLGASTAFFMLTSDYSCTITGLSSFLSICAIIGGNLRYKKIIFGINTIISFLVIVAMVVILFNIRGSDGFILSVIVLLIYSFGTLLSTWLCHKYILFLAEKQKKSVNEVI